MVHEDLDDEEDLGIEENGGDEGDGVDEVDDGDEVDESPSAERSGAATFISGLVLGALVGAGIALLVAPDRGKVTRRRLKKFMRRVRDQAAERLDHWRSRAESELARKRRELRQRLKERA